MTIRLTGCAWGHARGYDPMVATAARYAELQPDVQIAWEQRSLQAFADQPLSDLARQYDMIVVDHPHVGEVAAERVLVPLDEVLDAGVLAEQEAQSVGPSFASYRWAGHQWALATDAATQVAAYRPDLLAEPPTTWAEVTALATEGRVLWPLKPVDAISSFFTLSANRGTPVATRTDRLFDDDDAHAVLDALQEVGDGVPDECLGMNPFEVLEWMSGEQDRYAYCPLLYGYTNYARPGYRPRLVRFSDIAALGPHGPSGSMLGGAGMAISAGCAHPEAAAAYLAYVADAETQRTVYFDAGGQPGNATAWDDSDVNAKCSDFFTDTRETIERSWVRPRFAGYIAVQDRVGEFVNHLLRGQGDRAAALEQMHTVYRRGVAAAPAGGRDPAEEETS